MKKIVLISCVKKKQKEKSKAQDMYTSDLFKKSLAYARKLKPDDIFILSAKYGILGLDEKIVPYEMTLNKMSGHEKKIWAEKVLKSLGEKFDLLSDKFILLAGNNYVKNIIPKMKNYELPLGKMPIGYRLKFLKEKL